MLLAKYGYLYPTRNILFPLAIHTGSIRGKFNFFMGFSVCLVVYESDQRLVSHGRAVHIVSNAVTAGACRPANECVIPVCTG